MSFVFAILLSNVGFAATYYSQLTGDPTNLANWNTNRLGGGTSPSNFTTSGDIFIIQGTGNGGTSPHTMTMGSAWSPTVQVVVEAGATLNTSGSLLTVGNGAAAIDLDVFGTFVQNATPTFTGAAKFEAGSTYQMAMNGGTVRPATFDPASTVLISGTTTTAPTITAQTYGNMTVNAPSLSVSLSPSTSTIAGLLSIVSTGSSNFRPNGTTINDLTISGGTLSLSGNMTITGDMALSGGTFTPNTNLVTFTSPGVATITGSPTFYDLTLNEATSSLSASSLLNVTNNLTITAGALSPSAGVVVGGAFSNSGTINFSGSNNTFAKSFTNSGTVNAGTSTVTLNSGATAANLVATAATTFNNLTTSNTSATGISLTSGDVTVLGQLTLGGKITLGTSNLILGASAPAITGTSATNFIVEGGGGILKKTFGSGGSFTYPIGETTNFTPITATITGSSFGGTVGFNVIDAKNPQDNSSTDFLTRYWTLVSSGITGLSVSGTATYLAADITGTAANINAGVNNAGTATGWVKGATISSPTLSFTGLTTSGGFIGAVDGMPPTVISITPSVATIKDATVGSNTFSLTVVFSENMDQTVAPLITFPTGGEDPSGVITLSGGSWSNATTYVANYNVTDNNTKISNIDVRIATAQDVMKNVMAAATTVDKFNLDMTNPTATITSNLSILKDANVGTGTFTITATYSESMNAGVAPTIAFPVESPGSALTLTGGVWSGGNTIYTATYNVSDINSDVLNIDVSATGAQNPNGNTMTPKTQADLFSIQMLNPTLSPVTIASNNTNSTSVAKSGEVIKILFTASETLGALPTATIDGQAASVSLISGLNYQATLTMAAYPEVAVPIVINFTDVNGNTGTVTATTDASSVTYDRTAPTNQNLVYPTGSTQLGGKTIPITASLNATDKIWFAPAGLTTEGSFVAGATMTKAASGSATSIVAPTTAGSYKLYVIDLAGNVSAASTATLVINNTPILAAIEAGAQSYTENGAGVPVTSTTTVDDDGTNMTGATVQITGNYSSGNDVLSYTTTAGVSGAWNAGTGTMTLSGTASLASYQAAIRAVLFSNTSDNPSVLARTISIQATDATSALSNIVTRTINVVAVNDPPTFTSTPVLNATATSLYTYDVNATDVDNTLAFANITMPTGPVWLSLSVGGTGLARLSGTPPVGTSGPINVTLTCTDGAGGSTNQSFVINVTNAVVVDASGAGNYLTLQAAVNAVAAGSKIVVNAGTYTENVTINKNLDIAGASAASCIFNGNCAGSVITVVNGATVTISNITVQNGCGTFAGQNDAYGPQGYYGGGFYIYGATVSMTSVTIKNNSVAKNGYIGGSGGGAYIGGSSSVTMTGVNVTGNTSALYRGGGICIEKSSLTMDATSTVSGNGGCNYGGGLYSWSSSVTINGTISGNTQSGTNTSLGKDVLLINTPYTYPSGSGSTALFYHIAP